MKLGNKLYISATLIEAKTAKVLSSSKAEITDLGDAPNVLVGFAKNVIEGLSLKIGDIGPGGGLIFYIEGNKALECSELLGEANWEDAKRMCSEYRGGGYDDWYLPNKEELNWIYENLRRKEKIIGDTWYWSSSSYSTNNACAQSFNNGYQNSNYKNYTGSVRAVRAFNTSAL